MRYISARLACDWGDKAATVCRSSCSKFSSNYELQLRVVVAAADGIARLHLGLLQLPHRLQCREESVRQGATHPWHLSARFHVPAKYKQVCACLSCKYL